MSQRDLFPVACLLRSRMPSADRYFLCLPKLVRQLKSSAPARARISRLYYAFFYQIALPNKSRTNHKRHEWDHKKAQKTDSVLFRLPFVPLSPSLIWAKPLSRSTFTCRSLYEVGWGADQTPEAADGVLLLAHR